MASEKGAGAPEGDNAGEGTTNIVGGVPESKIFASFGAWCPAGDGGVAGWSSDRLEKIVEAPQHNKDRDD